MITRAVSANEFTALPALDVNLAVTLVLLVHAPGVSSCPPRLAIIQLDCSSPYLAVASASPISTSVERDSYDRVVMKIQDLLNIASPASSTSDEKQSQCTGSQYSPASSPPPSNHASALPTPEPSPTKRVKQIRDAAVFDKKGKRRGEINFPPSEADDGSDLAAEHERFKLHPRGQIAKYFRHIPYASDKIGFFEKTGRQGFDGMLNIDCSDERNPADKDITPVYQYTFRMPGEQEQRTVMWDYTTGLVRITPFFKCLNYGKTIPARVLNRNIGLRDLCHSITGGAIAAQGYWMPFNCARAVAATFCYEIRHALTPIFGPDFPKTCIEPSEPDFGRMLIDKAIIHDAADEARVVREACSSRYGTPSSTCATPPAPQEPASNPTGARAKTAPSSSKAPAPEPCAPTKVQLSRSALRDTQWTLTSEFHPKTKTIRIPRASTPSESESDAEDSGDDSDVPVSPKTLPSSFPKARVAFNANNWMPVNHVLAPRTATHTPLLSSVPTSPRKRKLPDLDGSQEVFGFAWSSPSKKICLGTSSDVQAARAMYTPSEVEAALGLLKLRYGDVRMVAVEGDLQMEEKEWGRVRGE